MNLFFFYDALMDVTQLLEANVVVSEHVEKDDTERVNIGLEIVGSLLAALCKLFRCRKAQRTHSSRHWLAKRRALQVHCRLHLCRVLLYLQLELRGIFMKVL